MRLRPSIVVCLAGLLAACASAAPERTATPGPTPTVSTPPAPPDTAAPRRPHTASPPVREAARTPAPPPIIIPQTLLGLAPAELDGLFGPANLVRRDGPAEIRLYGAAGSACTLHVFLYEKSTGGGRTVEFVEARRDGRRLAETDLAGCYRALAKPPPVS